MAGIGILFLIILYQSGQVMAAYDESGQGNISVLYWVLVFAILALCALIPILLRDSEPMEFKVLAILFTAIVPVVALAFVVGNVWYLLHK